MRCAAVERFEGPIGWWSWWRSCMCDGGEGVSWSREERERERGVDGEVLKVCLKTHGRRR